VVVAAGGSTRMGAGGPRKPLLELAGRPLLEHACRALDVAATVREVVVVVHAADVATVERWCAERAAFGKVRAVVAGGASRAESVRIGTFWCAFDVDVIAVHDAARPLVRAEHVDRVVRAAAEHGAALLALPVRDTLKRETAPGSTAETVARDGLWAAQTPQAFDARAFRELVRRAAADGCDPTDDAGLWERYRGAVALVEGEAANLKVTASSDLALAAALFAARSAEARA
jgi:2-C-methyl-D-erythritol 4-phosphate cytidylyltransferase